MSDKVAHLLNQQTPGRTVEIDGVEYEVRALSIEDGMELESISDPTERTVQLLRRMVHDAETGKPLFGKEHERQIRKASSHSGGWLDRLLTVCREINGGVVVDEGYVYGEAVKDLQDLAEQLDAAVEREDIDEEVKKDVQDVAQGIYDRCRQAIEIVEENNRSGNA